MPALPTAVAARTLQETIMDACILAAGNRLPNHCNGTVRCSAAQGAPEYILITRSVSSAAADSWFCFHLHGSSHMRQLVTVPKLGARSPFYATSQMENSLESAHAEVRLLKDRVDEHIAMASRAALEGK